MGYCPSQDWDRHVDEEDRQAEARAALFSAQADKIAIVASGLAWRMDVNPKPEQLTALVEDAGKIVAKIIANGQPPEDEPDIFDGPQPAGGSTQASELEAAKAKIADLERKLAEAERQRDIARESKEAVSTWVEKFKAEAEAAKAESVRYAMIAGAWHRGRLGRVGLFGKTVAFTVAGRKDEPFTVRTFEVEKIGESEAYRQALALALGEDVEVPASGPTVDDYREGFANLRDAVLNQRYQLADYDLDSDLVNSILGLIDDNNPATNGAEEGGEK